MMEKTVTLKIDGQGRAILPAVWRKKHGIGPSTELLASVDEFGGLRIETKAAAIRRAQALVRQYIPEGVSLVDELIEERRREADRERAE